MERGGNTMRKLLIIFVVCLLITLSATAVYAAPPPGGPPGLEQAIAVKERHVDALLTIPGVTGAAVGLNPAGQPSVIIFTEKPGISGLPAVLENVPVIVQVSGEFAALKRPPGKGGKGKNNPPSVSIASPLNGATYPSGEDIVFAGAATDKEDGNLTANLEWVIEPGGYTWTGGGFTMNLSDGTYTITASVTDSGGNTGSATIIIKVGVSFELYPYSKWGTPVPIGVSTGHFDITAGTIGARVKDSSGNVYALSNNHVYADENRASIGDNVLQPGPYDGGRNPGDVIGTLSNYIPIKFSRHANNVVDAAIALSSVSQLGNATPVDGYGVPKSDTVPAYVGQWVMKYGRTTGLTSGFVYAIEATVRVNYDSGVARFIHQIIIIPITGSFSLGGDSGSLIVSVDEERQPVGLLFAGNDLFTVANPINYVLEQLGVTIDGE
jgi:hypothetical protein